MMVDMCLKLVVLHQSYIDFEDDPNVTQDIDSSFEPDFGLMTPEIGGKLVAHICCVNFWLYHNSTFHGSRYHHSTIIIINNNFEKRLFFCLFLITLQTVKISIQMSYIRRARISMKLVSIN